MKNKDLNAHLAYCWRLFATLTGNDFQHTQSGNASSRQRASDYASAFQLAAAMVLAWPSIQRLMKSESYRLRVAGTPYWNT